MKELNILFDYPFRYSEKMERKDRVSYLAALLKVSDVDGIVKEELDIISQVISFCHWDNDLLDEAYRIYKDMDYEQLMPSNEIRTLFAPFLLRDAIVVAYIHEGINEAEEANLINIGHQLGIEGENYERIKKAVSNFIEAVIEMQKAMN
ncbi:MAG: hypothetical protein H8E98_05810 [Bacteroidetes bacterium]|nr:hypothetical protein [Bacteroidota bacterium]